MLKNIFWVSVLSTISLSALGSDFFDRVSKAQTKCGLSQLSTPVYEAPEEYMKKHYQPSNLQRVLTPVYTTIIDRFGGVVQGMITGGDEAYVGPTLRRLGRQIKRTPGLSKENKICMATCMVNYMMEGDDNVIPFSSMNMAVAQGKGFCRHFSLATELILEAADVDVDTEVAFDHMFLKTQIRGRLHYQDPMNENGRWSCTFFPANSVH